MHFSVTCIKLGFIVIIVQIPVNFITEQDAQGIRASKLCGDAPTPFEISLCVCACVFIDIDKADFIESRRREVLCRLRCRKEKSTYMDCHVCVSVSVPEDLMCKIF